MSYLQFHVLFILPPIVLLALTLRWPLSARHGRWAPLGLPLMALVALLYTTPWDNLLIHQGVWDYGEERVIGTLGYVPVEEYLFFLLQPLLTGLWLYRLLRDDADSLGVLRRDLPAIRVVGAAFWVSASIAGAAMLAWWTGGYYLGLILAWAGPVLAGQWAYGGDVLWRRRRTYSLGVAVPTLYLWAADRVAIGLGIWSISEEYTTGAEVLGLPLEEAVFFAATNLMVVGGLLLFLWLGERTRRRATPHSADAPDDAADHTPTEPTRA